MKKINIAELLKDCPKGMELDCTMYDNLYFDSLNADYYGTINCYTLINGVKTSINFTKYGTFNNHPGAKCVIFPKGKTTWEGFQRPFKDGDVLIKDNNALCIYKSIHKTYKNKSFIDFYCGYRPSDNQLVIKKFGDTHFGFISEAKLATEEEKQKLFDAIKANGYRWNAETKTLEKLIEPKFKVGDKIKSKINQVVYTITEVREDIYLINEKMGEFGYHVPFSMEKNYELVPNKFDITTLKPFDKVLVRQNNYDIWHIGFFEKYDNSLDRHPFVCMYYSRYSQCIPYEENKHLLGTTNDCDEFYKTWE